LKKQGIHVTTAQRLLGHSDPKITLSVYTRVLDNEIDDAGSVLTLMVKKAHSSEMRRQKSLINQRIEAQVKHSDSRRYATKVS
jgi:hypothetical protein